MKSPSNAPTSSATSKPPPRPSVSARNAIEQPFAAAGVQTVDAVQDSTLLNNVRLWDLRAYNATITQIQALRPYYIFPNTDVDRYFPNGRIKQVLLSPREIDVTQLSAEANQSWINPRFIYTHGFGVVMAEVNKITPDGLPVLLIENAPPEIKSPGFQLTRPEIYYGESTQDPVFVHTAREEFDYPQGDQNKYSTYQGTGGFPVGSFFLKAAAAISQGEPNILFTGYLTGQSRMMIYRKVQARLGHLAGFLQWDPDPYLVVTDDGRLVWMVDGYTTSLSHPYSATLPVTGVEEGANYIRNAVKATVDAYTGKISLYVFDPSDPIIQVYENLFPKLFQPASQMPPDLRRHARYPEVLFRTQAEAYRIFHMRDPQVFYNKEDIWEIAHSLLGQSAQPEPMQPTYVVATLPGEKEPEFLLDPAVHSSRQGQSHRLDGRPLRRRSARQSDIFSAFQAAADVRPHADRVPHRPGPEYFQGFDAVEPARLPRFARECDRAAGHRRVSFTSSPFTFRPAEARMPQLKKVVLAMGDRLIYRDTFEQALAELTGGAPPRGTRRCRRRFFNARCSVGPAPPAPALPAALADRISHLRDQAEQLAKDLDALEKETQKK